ncbi:MAG TPA: GuaB3 family IMP dehydrogenase-related protein, partial [Rubrobacter sp.]|nr:GuaB3 family IMP dehydrogenase-related protein [Rubrobacter sp.]
MDIEIGRGKTARRAYGLDEIAIVPSRRTRDPEDVDISWSLGDLHLDLPCLASALDAAVDPATAGIIGNLGGLAVLNLEGLQTRYEDPGPVFEEIASLPEHKATRVMQELYAEPIKEELIFRRVQEIKDRGVIAAASLTPQRVERYHGAAIEAG